ncbi:MAG: tripartite tricarboxylate transporter substrate binding protein [Betaproteobacteria bacterium]|nr:tripartite tricarboxylate transporter substrate binding protein [Betaproteobacteria bacterium]
MQASRSGARLRAFAAALFGAASLIVAQQAQAQPYPARVIRIVVPYAAGGGVDTVGRAVAQELTGSLGQSVIIDNRPGGNSVIGTEQVARALADGYTLLVTVGSHYAMPYLSKNVHYDPVKDFSPITIIGKAPQVLFVGSATGIMSVKDLIAYVKKNPGKVSFATSGAGTSQHLGGELLNHLAGLDMTHVPYKGGAPALTDVVGGQVPVGILIYSNVKQYAAAGKVRPLAMIEATRAKGAPDIPTMAEAGVPGFAVPDTWVGVLGPAGLPREVVSILNAAITKAAASADLRSRLEGAGFEVDVTPADKFAPQGPKIAEMYRSIITTAGIKPE